MLVEPYWLTDGSYLFGYTDAICSLLVENTKDFYITPNEQVVYVFLHKRGLIRILHDFRGMSDRNVNRVISLLLKERYG